MNPPISFMDTWEHYLEAALLENSSQMDQKGPQEASESESNTHTPQEDLKDHADPRNPGDGQK